LSHSPYERGGRLPRESFQTVIKHVLAMRYSAAEMILMAIEDLLEGPGHLHRQLPTKIGELRGMRQRFDDARFSDDIENFPSVRSRKPPRHGQGTQPITSERAAAKFALRSLRRQIAPLSDLARRHPQAALPHAHQQWWRIAEYDSVLVSSADGTSAAWYRRDPAAFRDIMRRNAMLHAKLVRQWEQLRTVYSAAVPELTSPEAWERTFAAAHPQEPAEPPSSGSDAPFVLTAPVAWLDYVHDDDPAETSPAEDPQA
jgi:galactofuranosylgalactofuranosylrhamnosyl-N-acetylglucosaminyl-diphospho-decaprenol beta-1,5/1,6-galactofuranosyltransferase